MDHSVAHIAMDDKRFFLERLINEHPDDKMLVFVRTKVRAERVFKAMERVGVASKTIHGDKEQKDRLEVMREFKNDEVKVLIATDVSARGIDIPNVSYVINYDLPEVAENYVHRVGRTGRGTAKGYAISFCSEEEKPILEEIETFLTKEVKVLDIDRQDYRETVDFATDTNETWQSLMKNAESEEQKGKKRKKKAKVVICL